MLIEGVEVHGAGFSRDELAKYVAYVKERVPEVVRMRVTLCDHDSMVDIDWTAQFTKFERIRSWNDAKRAEEHDRVKHA